ncbi:hypothetical protein EIP86_011093 [Pleurotus ostreatoroseus]|nr:hypothetical protein EIP86_011093 [Pleurotus ostreatoroseus]
MTESLCFITLPIQTAPQNETDDKVYFQTISNGAIHILSLEEFRPSSQVLDNVIALARAQNAEAGRSSICPIILTNISSEELELLGSFVGGYVMGTSVTSDIDAHIRNEDIFAVEELSTLLRAAYLFRVPNAIRVAVARLSHNPELLDSERLRLSITYGISSWFRPALKGIVMRPLEELRARDIQNIGEDLLMKVIRVHKELEGRRHSLILQPPVDSAICEDSTCLSAWRTAWVDGAVPILLDTPLGSLSQGELIGSLRARASGVTIRAECLEAHLAELEGVLPDEADIIDHFVEDLYDLDLFCRLGLILDRLDVW